MSFISGTQMELLYGLPAAVTNNTFTTQRVISAPATLPRAVIPAGYFTYSDGLWIVARGTVANAATAATFANVLSYETTAGTIGTNLIASFPALAPTASTTCPWELEAFIMQYAAGASGLTLQCNGKWRQSVTATVTFGTAHTEAFFRTQLTGLNSEAQAFIELWSTCSASSASSTITVEHFNVFGIN